MNTVAKSNSSHCNTNLISKASLGTVIQNAQLHSKFDHYHEMFSAFKKSLPQVSIFHRPSSPPSVSALRLLQSALSSPYPPSKPSAPPLNFDLEVVESQPPTPDQLATILSYVSFGQRTIKSASSELSAFLSSHPTSPSPSDMPRNAKGIVDLANTNPNAVKWPIVVDWTGGRASIGEVEGVKDILEAIRQERDGESKGAEEHKPKGWFS